MQNSLLSLLPDTHSSPTLSCHRLEGFYDLCAMKRLCQVLAAFLQMSIQCVSRAHFSVQGRLWLPLRSPISIITPESRDTHPLVHKQFFSPSSCEVWLLQRSRDLGGSLFRADVTLRGLARRVPDNWYHRRFGENRTG